MGCGRMVRIWLLACAAITAGQISAHGQMPVYEQQPHDVLVLLVDGQRESHKIVPLSPQQMQQLQGGGSGLLVVRLVSDPEVEYEVGIAEVERVVRFEQQLLNRVKELLRQRKLKQAFPYVALLDREYSDVPKVSAAVEAYLRLEAQKAIDAQRFERAWLQLDEAYQRNPAKREIQRSLAKTLHQVMMAAWAREDLDDVLRWRGLIEERYQGTQAALLKHWASRFEKKKDALQQELQVHLKADNVVAAHRVGSTLKRFWPDSDAARTAEDVLARTPTVIVGVSRQAVTSVPGIAYSWGERRVDRILRRRISEQTGVAAEGGQFRSPWGRLTPDDTRTHWTLRLEGLPEDQTPGTAFEVSQSILALAVPSAAGCRSLNRILESTEILGGGEVRLHLRHPHLSLPALLEFPVGEAAFDSPARFDRAYRPDNVTEKAVSFVADDMYWFAQDKQIRQIIERRMPTSERAFQELVMGRVHVLDRVFPSEVERLRGDSRVQVVPYAVPSVHILVPNMRNPVMRSRTFRRAIVYMLDRNRILNQRLLSGAQVDGCSVISAPIPKGHAAEDAIAYAYDETIEPREASRGVALTLLEVAKMERAKQRDASADTPAAKPQLRIVHPNDELSSQACLAIAEQIQTYGIATTVVPLPAGRALPDSEQWDLAYYDIVMAEPLRDLVELFGEEGIFASGSPYLSLALRRLDDVTDWKAARRRLREVHRLLHEEVTVVPLWQLQDHAAYRIELEGMRGPLMGLYDEVEFWKVND